MGLSRAPQVDPDLVAINEKLREYREAWDAYVDAWLVVRVGSPDWVYAWRLQAEHAMLATGRPGMTDEQARTQGPSVLIICKRMCLSRSG